MREPLGFIRARGGGSTKCINTGTVLLEGGQLFSVASMTDCSRLCAILGFVQSKSHFLLYGQLGRWLRGEVGEVGELLALKKTPLPAIAPGARFCPSFARNG